MRKAAPLRDDLLTPLRWRRAQPIPGHEHTLYEFAREYVCERGGACRRAELLAAMTGDLMISSRLANSQGFTRILCNFRNSGWIEFQGDELIATHKTLRMLNGSPH